MQLFKRKRNNDHKKLYRNVRLFVIQLGFTPSSNPSVQIKVRYESNSYSASAHYFNTFSETFPKADVTIGNFKGYVIKFSF